MKHIVFQALADAARNGGRVVLALISGTKGSSPQKVGAKALFYADGRIQGTLGGGCLEAEIQQRALESLRTGQPAAFDLLLDHDFGWDDGLICGGKVLGLILPDATAAGAEFWKDLAERRSTFVWGVKKDFSIARVADCNKDSVGENARPHPNPVPPPSLGSYGGTSQEREAERGEAGQSSLLSPALSSFLPQEEREKRAASLPSDWLYQETITPRCNLWIAGAGHIAQAAAPLAAQLDFNVTVFDDRPALANHHYFPREVRLEVDVWEKLALLPLPHTPAFGLIVTRGHRHDALVLKDWIHKSFLFLGMIGSSRKARIIFDHFREENIASPEQLQRVACPVGIPIKSQSVQEIAVSIMAQFIEKRAVLVYEKAGPPATRGELV